jgi:hypothetical protein
MKLRISVVAVAAVLLWANVSHACPAGSEADNLDHRANVATTAAAAVEPSMGLQEPQSNGEAPLKLTLLDHEGDSTDSTDTDNWASAVAELKIEWDLTGMLDAPLPASDDAGPQHRFLVDDEDEPLSSPAALIDAAVDVTGSSASRPQASQMAMEGYEDR